MTSSWIRAVSGGSTEWGPVQTAGLVLAGESPITVSVQVIDQTFAGTGIPTACAGPLADTSPSEAGFNGILGVGILSQDCGLACVNDANNPIYYSCSGSGCSRTAVALSSQVQNPVALLPQDNNGVLVQLPVVPSGGSPSISGSLVLGIGTQTNNIPSRVATYAADQFGEFITTMSGTNSSYSGVIDSGSNGFFFTPPAAGQLPDCLSADAGWF